MSSWKTSKAGRPSRVTMTFSSASVTVRIGPIGVQP
jgi:hypothetical protein